MDPIHAFLSGMLGLIVLTVGALACIQRPLTAILEELCRGGHRARFWARLFDALLLFLVIFCALWTPPRGDSVDLFALLAMFRGGMIGLLLGLTILALAVLGAILRYDRLNGIIGPPAGGKSVEVTTD